MSVQADSYLLGAYALTASLADFSRAEAEFFYRELQQLPNIQGLELPIHCDVKSDDPWQHLEFLPKNWSYVLTPLPAVMQRLHKNEKFGLASVDETSRQAALLHMAEVRQRIQLLQEHCEWASVRAVQVHSAPRLLELPTSHSREALRRSCSELAEWNWGGAELWLEHCDSPQGDMPAAKGFLSLDMELSIVQEFAWGLTLNWGRSVLEGRDPSRILQHIAVAKAARVLRCLIFSGVAEADDLYGNWQDNHTPLALGLNSIWEASGSLLTEASVLASLRALHPHQALLGIKVQPAPRHLNLPNRIAFIKEQLEAFHKIISSH